MTNDRSLLSRRRVVTATGSAALSALAGCATRQRMEARSEPDNSSVPDRVEGHGSPDETHQLTVSSAEVETGAEQPPETWTYNETYPGPELRVSEGKRVRIDVENRLPAETTVHWHGIPVPNSMDGVPGLTQPPIGSGDTFTYEFQAAPSGTYLYHSHVDLQLDRGLVGPLIIEEQSPHVEYDDDVTMLLDDYRTSAPDIDDGNGMGERPSYDGLLINGRSPTDPVVISVEEDRRVRLRFINGSSATTYRVGIGGHSMTVTHADGQAVDPVTVDSFQMGMGERYDVIVETENPGTWAIQATAIEDPSEAAQAVLQYTDAKETAEPEYPRFDGSLLTYEDLHSQVSLDVSGTPDRTFDLTLSSGMMMNPDTWMIDGQAYPDADPLTIYEGEHVRVRMVNHSMMSHPMHLHGHFFKVGDAVKDTVLVPPHMGEITFDFRADNPGEWFFHCHNLYHIHSGMVRVFRYASVDD